MTETWVTRRGFLPALACFPAAMLALGARRTILRPDRISAAVEHSLLEDGRARWVFQYFKLKDCNEPLVVGQSVYFNGSPFNTVSIDGVVTRVATDDFPAIQHVEVESEA